jgi:hypothetical protein
MLMDPLPNIGKVYLFLVQQERQSVTPFDGSKVLVSANNNGYRNSNPPGRGLRW